MSNVSWINQPGRIRVEQIDEAIRRHIESRFGEHASVTHDTSVTWTVTVDRVGAVCVIALPDENRITFKGTGDVWDGYIEWFVRTALAVEFHSTCGSEDDPDESWTPNPSKYPTLETYVRAMRIFGQPPDSEIDFIRSLPEPLR